MTRLDRVRLSLRELGELAGAQVEPSAEDRAGFEKLLIVPLRVLAREFRSPTAFGAFVQRKLEQGQERARVRRIAALFEAA